MKATEVTKKLNEIFDNLTDEEQKEAIRIAIRAIDQLDRMYLWYQWVYSRNQTMPNYKN